LADRARPPLGWLVGREPARRTQRERERLGLTFLTVTPRGRQS